MNKYRLSFLMLLILVFAQGELHSQNPIIRNQFTADPTARVFEGKVYLYPSHDIPAPDDYPRKDWFCMADYHIFSSKNLVDWTDHGMFLSQKSVDWVAPSSYSMWAPDCVFKNRKYYFFFPATSKDTLNGKGFGVGVAISDRPDGAFVPEKEPIKGIHGIDPNVLIDKDGQAYIYWAGGKIFVAKLKDNMLELASEPTVIENLPEGFKEGPFMFERNGIYYLTYPLVQDTTETLAYSFGDNPMGPFKFGGLIMDQSPTGCWTNHHSFIEYNNQWYLFYHHNDLSPNFDKNRSVRIDSLFFNADGSIQKVRPTLRGVGLTDAFNRIQIDRYSNLSETGASVDFLDTLDCFEGWKTILNKQNSWVQYNGVNFGKRKATVLRAKVRSYRGCTIDVRLDGINGTLVAQAKVASSNNWSELHCPILAQAQGTHNLYAVLSDGQECEIDWMQFDDGLAAGNCRNLLLESGYSQDAIQAKLDSAFYTVFEGPRRVYEEVGDTMAYISDVKNHDVRTEGMSYGMMIAVQMDKKEIFDRLWRWAKRYMQHQGSARDGYFGWSCKTSGEQNSAGSASDGELYFVTSLLFASNRWGNETGIDYHAEAKRILDAMFAKTGEDGVYNIINTKERLITFVPEGYGRFFTDPSYHLPVFYEIWARYANDGRADFWYSCARHARDFMHQACNQTTGLNSDYSGYDGSPFVARQGDWGSKFRFDSWRVPMNIALDYTWSGADAVWQRDYARRIHAFFRNEGITKFVDQYSLDGTRVENVAEVGGYKVLRHSIGLVSTLAAVSLALPVDESRDFLSELWNSRLEPYDDGYYDGYYDGLLYLFALMHLSGNYHIIEPINNK